MKKVTLLPTEAAPESSGAEMPSPFPKGQETEAIRRQKLVQASPTIASVRATAEAVVAEARRLEQEAEAALQARLEQAEVLRSLLGDEQKLVSQRAHFLGRPGEIAAEVAGVEASLNQVAVGMRAWEGQQVWAAGIERLVRLNVELDQVNRVRPLVDAELERVRTRRAEIQRELGFAVVGVDPKTGALEGAAPEPEAVHFEWRDDSATGLQRLQPVAA